MSDKKTEWIPTGGGGWKYYIDGELAYEISECHVYKRPSTFWAGRRGLGSSFNTLEDAKMTVEDCGRARRLSSMVARRPVSRREYY